MEQVKELLKTREKYLLQMKKDKEKALEAAPEGNLRICNSRNRTQYYQRTDPKDFNGSYIREQVYEKLHKERQKLVVPIWEPDEQYVRKWESVKYQGKGFNEDTPEFYTIKGERVRSKSELIIADLLSREGIPYRYEYPIYVKGVGKIYPDFTVLNVKNRKEMYWEHLGMMDDASYVEKALQKIEKYEQNSIFPGEKLILTYETRKTPLSQKQVKLMIRHYL